MITEVVLKECPCCKLQIVDRGQDLCATCEVNDHPNWWYPCNQHIGYKIEITRPDQESQAVFCESCMSMVLVNKPASNPFKCRTCTNAAP